MWNFSFLLNVDGLFYICKMVEIHHKEKLNYIINIYFHFKKINNVYNDLKILIFKFSNKFTLEIVSMFNVGIIRITFTLFLLGITFFL